MTTPRLIGLCGFARSGKDTIGSYLAGRHNYERQAFADKLRLLAEDLDPWVSDEDCITHIRYSEALASHGYEKAKDEFPEIRRFLVALGKGVRDVLGPDVWVDACLPPVRHAGIEIMSFNGPPTVVSDVRYLNEVQRIIDLGGEVWYINRRLLDPANPEEARSFREIFDSPLLDHPRFRILPNMGDGPTTLYPKIEELLRDAVAWVDVFADPEPCDECETTGTNCTAHGGRPGIPWRPADPEDGVRRTGCCGRTCS